MGILNINAPTFATTLAAPYTLAQCHTFLKQAFANAGFPTPTNEALGATNITVYDFNFNPSATHGRVFFVLETTISAQTITIRCRLHTNANYNSATFAGTASTGANNVTGATITVLTTNPLTAYSIPTTVMDIRGISILENGLFDGFLGLAYFAQKEPWYDENQWCWAMLVQPLITNSFWHCYPNPLNVAATTAVPSRAQITAFSTRNLSNTPYVFTAPLITSHIYGISGQFPTDIGITNSTGLLPGDILQVSPGVEEYWLAQPLENGLAFRCV
jgi:hypothetical protein